ncbi:hypothetical protein M1P56_26085 [Streptomyces sp. HU2014]|uniref:hypothetical protein n=1 Tax=Streptomyces sp. HU2014 TaxID=2939414 RepID=UPI00200D2AEB|nr:hypothetical protein [Streptomyces sp. HU2014]UQI47564.1 hypothetical protein M1P56_26085 [Streptomyces sp. HU2014]
MNHGGRSRQVSVVLLGVLSFGALLEEAEEHRRTAEHLAPQQDLFERFAQAVTKRMGCELPARS